MKRSALKLISISAVLPILLQPASVLAQETSDEGGNVLPAAAIEEDTVYSDEDIEILVNGAEASSGQGGDQSSDGFVPDTKGVGGFVSRMYTVVLGRQPEKTGYEYWKKYLITGEKNGFEVSQGFLFSDEFLAKNKSDEEYVTTLYNLFFDRAPDQAGFEDWVGKLAGGGYDRHKILDGFVNSIEWADTCLIYGIESGGTGTPSLDPDSVPADVTDGITRFVDSLYLECLGRYPSDEEKTYWTEALARKQKTGKEVAFGFFFSNEFKTKAASMTPESMVKIYYKVFLGRDPDNEGFADWVNKINGEENANSILFTGFSDSTEFADKCVSCGIRPGPHVVVPGVFTDIPEDFRYFLGYNDLQRGIKIIDSAPIGQPHRNYKQYNVVGVNTIEYDCLISSRDVAAIEKFAAEHFRPEWTNGMKLAYTCWWINRNVTYGSPGARGYAEAIFEGKVGMCAQYNGAMIQMMCLMGYDAYMIQGTRMRRSGSTFSHYWGEVNLNGHTYMFENGNAGDSGDWHFFICDYSETTKYVKNGTLMNW